MKSLVLYINELVTNHLTPIVNIMVNVRNIFSMLGLVCEVKDNVLIIKSSKFTSVEETNKILYSWDIIKGTSLSQYIVQLGLNDILVVPYSQMECMIICKATDIEEPQKYMNYCKCEV